MNTGNDNENVPVTSNQREGRADVIIETDDNVNVFEFKKDKSATEALKQIEDMGYAKPYVADKRRIYKIGVNFDSGERNITEWIVI